MRIALRSSLRPLAKRKAFARFGKQGELCKRVRSASRVKSALDALHRLNQPKPHAGVVERMHKEEAAAEEEA